MRDNQSRGKVTVVLDSQAGSCGKGKFIGYLATHDNIDIAMNNFMSNAGHTMVTNDGNKIMTQHLPTSLADPNIFLLIGPGSAITPNILFDEILKFCDLLDDRRIVIHPRANVILPKHSEIERQTIRSGSTFKGCGAACADKVMRTAILFGEWFKNTDWSNMLNTKGEKYSQEDISYIYDTIDIEDTMPIINQYIDCNYNVLIEGSQGCDLDINYGLGYPHTTSRQCHAGQLIADCGISPKLVDEIIMIMRPYPIRISNETNIGINISSGDYDGADEISWDIVKERCGAPAEMDFGEMTTVTKKQRRVFEMNWSRLEYVTMLNRPTQIALNFVQYIDFNAYGCTSYDQLSQKVIDFINKVEDVTGVPVTLIGTGERNDQIIDLRDIKIGGKNK